MRAFMLLVVLSTTVGLARSAETAPIALAIHGGAGTIERDSLSDEKEAAIKADLRSALKAGYAVLESDAGDSVNAVIEAIQVLEDSPHFNAGKGAVYNHEGDHELDASIMRGSDLNAGAVAAVGRIKNPIKLAAAVMQHSPHVMLSGEGAEMFARAHNIDFVENNYFDTPHREQQWRQSQASAIDAKPSWFSTVGAVALDRHGQLAAGTSTGGMTGKQYGRIGDSPIIGAGTYAENGVCAISATGHGEFFIRNAVAYDICARVKYSNESLHAAAQSVINSKLRKIDAAGGVIAMSADGQASLVFNTPGMYRASIDKNGEIEISIYGEQERD